MTVSCPQLDIADKVTVYLCLPLEQLPILSKTPTLIPADAVEVLNIGVSTMAQPEPPVDPPPPLPFSWPNNGIDTSVRHVSAKTLLIKQFLIDLSFLSLHCYPIRQKAMNSPAGRGRTSSMKRGSRRYLKS